MHAPLAGYLVRVRAYVEREYALLWASPRAYHVDGLVGREMRNRRP